MNQQDYSQQDQSQQTRTEGNYPQTERPSGYEGSYQSHSPNRAAFFALIPGLGAVYNREYMKAVLHFAIFAGLFELSSEVTVFALAVIAFYVFQMMDAYRFATVVAEREKARSEDRFTTGESEMNLPLWGGALVLMGVVLLLDTLGAIRLSSIATYWPIAFIALGLYLIFKNLQGAGSARDSRRERREDRGAPVRTAGPVKDEEQTDDQRAEQ